jgi:hypothetical protein
MFDDLVTHRAPPPNRIGTCEGDTEWHLPEGAVIMAFAMHLLRTVPGLREVSVHPDGEHGKRFDFQGWLGKRGFALKAAAGKTSYGGTYASPDGQTVIVNPSSGRGDVAAAGEGFRIVAECKGGIINTRHPGQLSRLRQGLCETVGLSLASPAVDKRRQFAVVPRTKVTESLARRLFIRATAGDIGSKPWVGSAEWTGLFSIAFRVMRRGRKARSMVRFSQTLCLLKFRSIPVTRS